MNCCDITAGMLKTPVTFERMTRIADGSGGYNETWAKLRTTKGMVKAMSGSERWASDRVEATSTHRLTVRYFSDLTEVDRVIVRGRPYNIRFINNVELEDKWLIIDMQLGVAV